MKRQFACKVPDWEKTGNVSLDIQTGRFACGSAKQIAVNQAACPESGGYPEIRMQQCVSE